MATEEVSHQGCNMFDGGFILNKPLNADVQTLVDSFEPKILWRVLPASGS